MYGPKSTKPSLEAEKRAAGVIADWLLRRLKEKKEAKAAAQAKQDEQRPAG